MYEAGRLLNFYRLERFQLGAKGFTILGPVQPCASSVGFVPVGGRVHPDCHVLQHFENAPAEAPEVWNGPAKWTHPTEPLEKLRVRGRRGHRPVEGRHVRAQVKQAGLTRTRARYDQQRNNLYLIYETRPIHTYRVFFSTFSRKLS